MSKAKSSAAKVSVLKENAPSSLIELRRDAPEGQIAGHMRDIIGLLGEDATREGLQRTPIRVEKAFKYLTSGYSADVQQIVNGALFDVNYDEVVIVRDIEFFSMCEHHMLPFFGKIHVAYLPGSKVIGLSKIPRLVDVFARRLQIQERLTQQVAETIQNLLNPRGVGVICEARHFCMMMRGVEKQHSGAITSAMLGAFRENKETRNELLSLIAQRARAI
ncbi:MAG TPA: GTP cyclohydrolase I FolE [Bryobacteraceae bacterium]|nr:GTP cyclohydrolase I FolE [Bryobacteraceae bacterium]